MPARRRARELRRRREQAVRDAVAELDRRQTETVGYTDALAEDCWREHEQDRDPKYVPCSCYTPLIAHVADDLAKYRSTGDHAGA